MKKTTPFLSVAILLAACEAEELTTHQEETGIPADSCIVYTDVLIDNVWSSNYSSNESKSASPRHTRAEGVPAGVTYCFNENGVLTGAISNSNYPGTTFQLSLNHITGTFTQYYICGMPNPNNTTDRSLTPTTPIPFEDEVYEMYIGSTTFDVTQSKRTYNTSITAKHLISQIAFTIKSVPPTVESIICELPNQATHYSPSGALTGNTKSISIPLTKTQERIWSVDLTNVYPCADGTTSMNIYVKVKYNNMDQPQVYKTSTTDVCKPNRQVKLSSLLNAISNTNITIDDRWSETIESNIDLGEGTTEE